MSSRIGTVEGSAVARQRQALAARLRARRAEMVQTALTRSYGLSPDGVAITDPQYMEGLRAAVEAAVEYGVTSIERGEANLPLTPPLLLGQARLAAISKIPLDTVLRRYFAGFTLFGDFVSEEATSDGFEPASLRTLMRELASLFDRLVEDIADEYAEARAARFDSSERRFAERVKKLLDGELIDTRGFDYDFDGFHLGVVAVGMAAEESVRALASAFDRRPLLVRPSGEVVWGWMGGRRPIQEEEIDEVMADAFIDGAQLALGEPTRGLTGWRLTHRQAKAALPIALRSENAVRYGGVALLACALQDDLLATSLREIYLRPLERERDGGEAARQTLLAYFAAERNVSSTAARMGVSRRTVTNRLRVIEQRLGRPLAAVSAEMETILRLDEMAR